MKVVADSITTDSTSPTNGTISAARRRMRESTARNSAVPASANTAASPILAKTGMSGHSSTPTSMPMPADSAVPMVDGST
ncbi:hypothetical protein D3C72_2272720 [compost metagenome]